MGKKYTQAKATYMRDYEKANYKQYSLKVSRIHEADIVSHLEAQGNISGYIKDLIKADMKG